ncbi:MAG: glutamate-cysteine ligase family protein [Thiohalomonadales bacterium]
MGDEIDKSEFTEQDVTDFRSNLITETLYLSKMFESSVFEAGGKSGLEIETCLVDDYFNPLCINDKFLKKLNDPLASAELAQFNVEINSVPRKLSRHFLSSTHVELNNMWRRFQSVAKELEAKVLMIGILPTLTNDSLNLANLSRLERYRALNRETIRLRKGKPLKLDISGVEHLRVTHRDVMLEAAATSLQIHLKLDPDKAHLYYNASLYLSSAMVALTANSPFLFGKNLWAETRIPLFEQAVALGGFEGATFGPIRRVSFGSRYVQDSLMELFTSNLDHYPILLPVNYKSTTKELKHLRLHNGTIWRWNRPIIGFEDNNKIHLRLEHRTIAAGPSVIDTIANIAFYYGVLIELVESNLNIHELIDFGSVRDNFYKAAQFGLNATVVAPNKKLCNIRTVLIDTLLPMAKSGLEKSNVVSSDISEYLGIIEQRLTLSTNGSQWQRIYQDKHQCDMHKLTKAYYERQQSGDPVHTWTV